MSLKNSNIAVDALDNFKSRIYFEKTYKDLNKSLLHSAINGHTGQMRLIFPEDEFLKINYSKIEDKYIETRNYFSSVMMISGFVSLSGFKFFTWQKRKNKKRSCFF
ncbi:MAG: hypothetical protein RBR08_07925 [Desulforegulaceae bacterium]|nr:hypothetical protein [Desulforegulaceae bacterium]